MQAIRTIQCKLSIDPNDVPRLNELFSRYAKAVSEIAQWGRDHRESNAVRLHHALYRTIREKYGLQANLVVTALRRASGMLKAARLKGKFEVRPTFVAVDRDTFTLKLDKGIVTLASHDGRIKAILDIGDYQREALRGKTPTAGTLIRSKKGFFLNVCIDEEVEDVSGDKVLGVDLGIRNVAVTSTGRKFDGNLIRKYREERLRIRASLQSNGTRNAKRVLRRLSGREARRAKDLNHVIAKAIVQEAVRSGCSVIALENLKRIRSRLRIPSKHLNRMVSLWSFAQLQAFIRYKAAIKGIRVIEINPAYTSQTCHKCFKRGVRNRETFTCTTCGIVTDADVNAALVIAAGGVAVNRPGSDGSDQKSLQLQAPHFSAG